METSTDGGAVSCLVHETTKMVGGKVSAPSNVASYSKWRYFIYNWRLEDGRRNGEPFYYWGFLLLLMLLYYVIISLTPLFCDDWNYCMMMGGEDRRIETLSDVFVCNYYHYFQVNGRVVPHLFVMTFDGLLDKCSFNLFSTVLFGLYLHLLTINFVRERAYAVMGLAISAALTVCFMCGFKYEFLWMSGVFNYEFVAVLVLLFHWLLGRKIQSKWWMPLLFLYGVVVGWTNEAVVIGLCCAYLLVVVARRKTLAWSQWVLLTGLVVGVALCVFSPGSIHRALEHRQTGASSLAEVFLSSLKALPYMLNLRIFFLMLILVFFVKKVRKEWLVGVVTSFVFVVFTRHDSGQSRFGIEFFSLIMILYAFPYSSVARFVGKLTLSATIAYLLLCLPYCWQNYQDFENAEKQIKQKQMGIIAMHEVDPSFYAERMVLPFLPSERDPHRSFYDGWVAHYYGRQQSELLFLPERFLDDVRHGLVRNSFDVNQKYSFFYACQWTGEKPPSMVKYVLKESKWATFPILNRMERFAATEMPVNGVVLMEFEGTKYLLLKKNPMIQERVIDIMYE
ncbi:MAG: hypothetical protein IJ693_08665 [Bacteroidaceae bacterium]|nr:hypothetical protein [Bacteroidaceae bacterium]